MMEQPDVELTPEVLQQHPLLAVALGAMVAVYFTILAGSLLSWGYLIYRARRGQPWLTFPPRGPRVWGLADLVVVATAFVVCQSAVASGYVRWAGIDVRNLPDGELPAVVGTVASLGNVLAVAASLLWLSLRYNVAPSHLGFHTRDGLQQLKIAGVTLLAALPIVYVLMAVVSIGMDAEYAHPLLDEIRTQASLGSYLLGVVAAVLVAPLAEEFLFRVLIQGWLQSWPLSSLREIVLGASPQQRAERLNGQLVSASLVSEPTPPAPAQPQPPQIIDVAGGSPPSETPPQEVPAVVETSANQVARGVMPKQKPPLWPAVVTGVLFGMAHWGYGLSFIPLIVLGIVLGLVYRATNSIWPSFLIHLSLNAVSMLGLGVGILLEQVQVVAGWWWY